MSVEKFHLAQREGKNRKKIRTEKRILTRIAQFETVAHGAVTVVSVTSSVIDRLAFHGSFYE